MLHTWAAPKPNSQTQKACKQLDLEHGVICVYGACLIGQPRGPSWRQHLDALCDGVSMPLKKT